jgi:hypothetical protein
MWQDTNVSEDFAASIFISRVKMDAAKSSVHGITTQRESHVSRWLAFTILCY